MTKQQYKIHIAYINTSGTLVPGGIYEEGTFDLAEARKKSLVTLANIDFEKSTQHPDVIPVFKFNQTDEIPKVEIKATTETVTIKPLKINSATVKEIEALKYVSKKTAEQVVEARKTKSFSTYGELDKLVPLKGKNWQDISNLDFEDVVGHTTENSIQYSEGLYPLS